MGGQVKLKLPEFQHCLFTKQRLTQEFTEDNSVSVRPSVRDPMVKQT